MLVGKLGRAFDRCRAWNKSDHGHVVPAEFAIFLHFFTSFGALNQDSDLWKVVVGVANTIFTITSLSVFLLLCPFLCSLPRVAGKFEFVQESTEADFFFF